MKIEEPESMKEIRRIREKQYEETRGMSRAEQVEYDRKKAAEALSRSGIKLNIANKKK